MVRVNLCWFRSKKFPYARVKLYWFRSMNLYMGRVKFDVDSAVLIVIWVG